MSKKKNKFDLSQLVHDGAVKEGETLHFVSDPTKTCKVFKHPSGEYKVQVDKEVQTVHQFAVKCLGQEPPDHGSKWVRTASGKTLFDLWHAQQDLAEAA